MVYYEYACGKCIFKHACCIAISILWYMRKSRKGNDIRQFVNKWWGGKVKKFLYTCIIVYQLDQIGYDIVSAGCFWLLAMKIDMVEKVAGM